MIKKYILLTSFVFGVGALLNQNCEAKYCCCGVKNGKCQGGVTVLWGDCPEGCDKPYKE